MVWSRKLWKTDDVGWFGNMTSNRDVEIRPEETNAGIDASLQINVLLKLHHGEKHHDTDQMVDGVEKLNRVVSGYVKGCRREILTMWEVQDYEACQFKSI